GGHPLLLEQAVDVLQHHDGVVDYDPDDERERQQGDRVQREAERRDQGEGGDDRCRDRQGRDQRGSPVPQEDEHHQRGQDGADDQVLLHGAGGRLHEHGLVAHDPEVVPGGQERLDRPEAVLEGVHDVEGGGGGRLLDLQQHGRRPVDVRGGDG